MRLIVNNLILVLLVALGFPSAAAAIVTGSAEWNWADYQRDVDGADQIDASHFYQQYSLLYRDRLPINGGRAGFWNMGLGYEWTSLDTTINDDSGHVDTGKILFEGELRFTPGGLPLSLEVFSNDLQGTRPSLYYTNGNTLVEPNIVGGLYNGQHVTSGATLLLGEAHSSAYGAYRNMLEAFPRVLIDYREDYVRDVKSNDPQHYRLRDLAFVSLNRKKNWFHYKIFEFTDFNDSSNDFKERTLMLGSVDHLGRRQWIDLTNWLAISVDGSLTRYELPAFKKNDEEVYRLNLFSMAKRREWNFSNFSSLSRLTNTSGKVEKSLDVPFFAMGQWDPLNTWRFVFLGERWEESNNLHADSRWGRGEDAMYAKFQLENRQFNDKVFVPEAELDWVSDTYRGDGRAARLGAELRSGSSGYRGTNWRAAYSLAWFDTGEMASDYFEQVARVSADTRLSVTATAGVSQEVALGSGEYSPEVTNKLAPTIARGFSGERDQERALSDTSYRTITNVYLELNPSSRLRQRFSADYDFLHSVANIYRLRLDHDLRYTSGPLQLQSHTYLEEGDELTYEWNAEEVTTLEWVTGDPELILSHRTQVDYSPNRFWMTDATVQALWGKGERGDGWSVDLEQKAVYHLYEPRGRMREWMTLGERFEYQGVWGRRSAWYARMELSASYYPTRYLVFGAQASLLRYGLTDENELEFSLTAAANFRKFQANLTYAYGQANDTKFLPGIKEQRWQVGLKKTF